MPDDKVSADPAAILAEIAERERLVAIGYVRDPKDVPRLLAVAHAALKLHGSVPWYCAASDCEHPEPEDELSGEHDDWYDNHPPGAGDIGLICRLTQVDSFCPECTRLMYDTEEPEGDDFVSAPCDTRSAVLAALTGEEKADG